MLFSNKSMTFPFFNVFFPIFFSKQLHAFPTNPTYSRRKNYIIKPQVDDLQVPPNPLNFNVIVFCLQVSPRGFDLVSSICGHAV